MSNGRRSSFSLLTLFLVIAIAALGVSHYVMMRRVQESQREVEAARKELELVRKEFGYLRIDDPQKIYVTEARNGLRLYIPRGHRFLLHVGETDYAPTGPVGTPKPIATMSMNSWREGADVILHCSMERDDGKARRFKVWTDAKVLFDVPINVPLADYSKDKVYPDSVGYVGALAQQEFSPEDRIELYSYGNDWTKRGIVVWMEPLPGSMRKPAKPAKN